MTIELLSKKYSPTEYSCGVRLLPDGAPTFDENVHETFERAKAALKSMVNEYDPIGVDFEVDGELFTALGEALTAMVAPTKPMTR